MRNDANIQQVEAKYRALSPLMDERMRRQWAAAEARSYGWGGLQAVSAAIHMSANTIRKGLVELAWREKNPEALVASSLRRKGGGRKRRSEADPGLVETLEQLVEPLTRGDPESPLRWTCKSTTHLAEELSRQGHPVSPRTVGRLLRAAGYSLQSNRKTKEGESHPDRNAQFEYINTHGTAVSAAWPAGDFGRHQEEGTGRSSSRMVDVNGSPKASPNRSGSTISWIRSWARRFPTGSTT